MLPNYTQSVELDAELFTCYYSSGNYDADLHSGASGFVMKRIQTLMEKPFSKDRHFPLTVEVGSRGSSLLSPKLGLIERPHLLDEFYGYRRP